MNCIECGRKLEDYEDDLCEDCMNNLAGSVLWTDDIEPNAMDF